MRVPDRPSFGHGIRVALALVLCASLGVFPACNGDDTTVDPPTPKVTVTITSPVDDSTHIEGDDILLAGTASDPDGVALTGAALVWTSDLDGPLGTGESFNTDLSEGRHAITLTATDGDGLTGTASVSITVNQGVVAIITSPMNDAVFIEGEDIAFNGSGTDPFAVVLTGASLVWTASPGGTHLGTGETLTEQMPVGDYKITLTATDVDDRTGTDEVDISVAPAVTATIISPTAGGSYDEFTEVLLSGTAQDRLGTPLTGDSLAWRSNRSGALGTGESLSVLLREGEHVIALTATDALGRFVRVTVTITVTGDGVEFDLTGDWTFNTSAAVAMGAYFSDPGPMSGTCTIVQTGAVINLVFTSGYLTCSPLWICDFDGTGTTVHYNLGNSGQGDVAGETLTNSLTLIAGTSTFIEGVQLSVYEFLDTSTSSLRFNLSFTKVK